MRKGNLVREQGEKEAKEKYRVKITRPGDRGPGPRGC